MTKIDDLVFKNVKEEIKKMMTKYFMYGMELGRTENDTDNKEMIINIAVPEHSEIKLNNIEAAGEFLAKSFKEEYQSIINSYNPSDDDDNVRVRVRYKIIPGAYTFQDSADSMERIGKMVGLLDMAFDVVKERRENSNDDNTTK